jgi:hypothetical protein
MSESQIFVNAVRDSSTETLVKAIRIIVDGMQSKDGLPNAVIQEAAERLEKQKQRIKRLEEGGDEAILPFEYAARVRIWTEAKETAQ